MKIVISVISIMEMRLNLLSEKGRPLKRYIRDDGGAREVLSLMGGRAAEALAKVTYDVTDKEAS